MTEDEAKTKWCPFARAQTEDEPEAAVVNRAVGGKADYDCYCLGSACMAWTWVDGERKPFRVSPEIAASKNFWAGYIRLETAPDEKGWVELIAPPPVDGFCGLAGKP